MIDGMEAYVGRKLKPEIAEQYSMLISGQGYFTTRPDFYSSNIQINMNIHVNSEGIITDFTGIKCYSVCRGLYNRSSTVHPRSFSARDLAYLRKYVRSISD